MKSLSTLLFLLILSSCSTSKVLFHEGREIKPLKKFEETKSTAKVQVIRDSGFPAMGCIVQVLVDNQLTAELSRKEYVTINLEPGKYKIGVVAKENYCLGQIDTRTMFLKSGDHIMLRAGIQFGDTGFQLTDF